MIHMTGVSEGELGRGSVKHWSTKIPIQVGTRVWSINTGYTGTIAMVASLRFDIGLYVPSQRSGSRFLHLQCNE